jgi:hypothetical protein
MFVCVKNARGESQFSDGALGFTILAAWLMD